jgi:hypothetical protein
VAQCHPSLAGSSGSSFLAIHSLLRIKAILPLDFTVGPNQQHSSLPFIKMEHQKTKTNCPAPDDDLGLIDIRDLPPIISAISDAEAVEFGHTILGSIASNGVIMIVPNKSLRCPSRTVPKGIFQCANSRGRPSLIVPLPVIAPQRLPANGRAPARAAECPGSDNAADDPGVRAMFDEFINLPKPGDGGREMAGVLAQSDVPGV